MAQKYRQVTFRLSTIGSRTARRTTSALAILLAATLAQAATPSSKSWVLDITHGSGLVTFKAVGRPSMLKINGKGDAPKGELKVAGGKVTGKSTFDLTTLDTGIKLRNTHMKEKYLETAKYPQATLTITEMKAPDGFEKPEFKADDVPFKGSMALHGVEKPVEGKARLERKGEQLEVETAFTLKTDDFKIATPSFAGVTMTEKVDVTVQVTAPFRKDQ